jgi:hypothetical protein
LAFDLLTSNVIQIFFVPWIVHMCDMVSVGGKDNTLKTRNHITFELLNPNLIGNIFLSRVVHMCDKVTIDGKGNVLKPGNYIDLWIPNSVGNIFLT